MLPWISIVLTGIAVGCYTAITLWYLRVRRRIEGEEEASAWELYCGLWTQDDDIVEAFDSVSLPLPPTNQLKNQVETHERPTRLENTGT